MSFIANLVPGLSFGVPYMLWALIALPAIYWLLRVTPPAPKRIIFPPLRLLFGLNTPQETPAVTPWWLLAMRIIAAGIVVVALCEPIYDTTPAAAGNGPLILVVDNSWAAAPDWTSRVNAMHGALASAQRDRRQVALLFTAETVPGAPPWLDAERALSTADQMVPEPWLPDRRIATAKLAPLKIAGRAQVIWLSDGIDDAGARAFADALARTGNLSIFADDPDKAPIAIRPVENSNNGFGVMLVRANTNGARSGRIAAIDGRGSLIEDTPFRFAPGAAQTNAAIQLPVELRNDTTRLTVQGVDSAGAVQLVDARYRRRPVGLVSANVSDTEQPLLSDLYYIDRALQPYAEVRRGTLDQLLDSGVAVVVLADIGQLTQDEHDKLAKFVEQGGLLLRFAGPKLAARPADSTDDLIPVKLRSGERLLGSALAWAEPQHLAPFGQDSPFRGLAIPADVVVARQVLAEPSVELAERSWARLTDGTPLVTAAARGHGWVVLVHVSASPGWSTLPLSGLYVQMLRRIVEMSGGLRGEAAARTGTLPPYQTLDGYGHLGAPYPEAVALKAEDLENAIPNAQHPPGLYGVQGSVVALNAVTDRTVFHPLSVGRSLGAYSGGVSLALKWPLLEIAMLVLLADALVSLMLRGYLPMLRRHTAIAALCLMMFTSALVFAPPARADDVKSMASALDTRLAYVITGTPDVDEMSRAGLYGLGLALAERTAYEPAAPVGVDLEKDDLSFYPLLYWPMVAGEKDLSPQAAAKVDAFMREGGVILFDTRDEVGLGGDSEGVRTLKRIVLGALDIPPLQPVPPDHVLTKTFYLMKGEYPGRWEGGQVWVESLPPVKAGEDAPPARGGDNVSPVIIGSNDWAAAWARNEKGQPIAAIVPGGDAQREMAIRFGINVVIYALTGNYKTDQVHAPALLERLGK